MGYTPSSICAIVQGRRIQQGHENAVEHLLTDSRRLTYPATTIFFAMAAPRRNGHSFIETLYRNGVRSFVVEQAWNPEPFPEAAFIQVNDSTEALQALAAHHRSRFPIPVVGITGSNGKTITKEWLARLLEKDRNIVKNPQSYNSQTGVPLSVWQITEQHDLGIFEAGISRPGEMAALEKIIQPTIGLLTHIGEAHNEGFAAVEEKIKEKLQLFTHCDTVIYSTENETVNTLLPELFRGRTVPPRLFGWGRRAEDELQILKQHTGSGLTHIEALYRNEKLVFRIPFTDTPSVNNALHCCCLLLHLGYTADAINQRLGGLEHMAMRLEQVRGINNCILVNDSYSADLSALQPALDYLVQQSAELKKTVILSDILQSGRTEAELVLAIGSLVRHKQIARFIGIGPVLFRNRQLLENIPQLETAFYETTEAFRTSFSENDFRNEAILLKGARVFAFEQIARLLEEKVHETILEIHLDRLVHNFHIHQQAIRPETKMMVIVKAFSYGSGSVEVARVLQKLKTDYLAVAYADEGVELRKAGIQLPIMVMNAGEAAFDVLTAHLLEPEIYSPAMFTRFLNYLQKNGIQQYPVHLKLDTGMHRLGFAPEDMPELLRLLAGNERVQVKSVFSHLAGSEAPELDAFTQQQFSLFETMAAEVKKTINYSFLTHIANSAAILRHPQLQAGMVRLGIGLYGIEPEAGLTHGLLQVCELKTTIAQIKHLKAGETVGYNRRGKLEKDSVIATVRIGYADGYPRNLGNGRGKMRVNGVEAPVIGSVCMDMTMLNITGIPNVREGDYVWVWGDGLPVAEVAKWAETIPYELLTGISQRVKRIYYGE